MNIVTVFDGTRLVRPEVALDPVLRPDLALSNAATDADDLLAIWPNPMA